jgi:hypothetical protein
MYFIMHSSVQLMFDFRALVHSLGSGKIFVNLCPTGLHTALTRFMQIFQLSLLNLDAEKTPTPNSSTPSLSDFQAASLSGIPRSPELHRRACASSVWHILHFMIRLIPHTFFSTLSSSSHPLS